LLKTGAFEVPLPVRSSAVVPVKMKSILIAFHAIGQ